MYGLVYNNQIVVGPRAWNQTFFTTWLEEHNFDTAQVPRLDPKQAIITNDWKIIPVTNIAKDPVNQPFERATGPFWTIHQDHITGTYGVEDMPLYAVKSFLKDQLATNRYQAEISGVDVTVRGENVRAYTSREDRGVYLEAVQLAPDDTTEYNFKFMGNKFLAVNRLDLQVIIAAVAGHIQSVFSWEAQKTIEVELAETKSELEAIDILHPSQQVQNPTV